MSRTASRQRSRCWFWLATQRIHISIRRTLTYRPRCGRPPCICELSCAEGKEQPRRGRSRSRGSDKAEGECVRRARIAGHKPEQSLERRRKTPASSNRARLGTAGFKRRRTPMELYVGIDVAKDTLEVATSGGESFSAINDAAGRAQLIERLLKLNHALLVELVAVDIDCARVNPVDVRYFARMHRQFAKTDRLDARLLAAFAQHRATELVPARLDAERDELKLLVNRRTQLLQML